MENPQEVITECLSKFSTSDYIMEPGIFTQLKRYNIKSALSLFDHSEQLVYINFLVICRYFQAGGTPEQVINQISQNYTAVAQMANLLAEWLILAGVAVADVQAMVENHLKDMILRTFDPKKADTIFTEEGEVSAVGSIFCFCFDFVLYHKNLHETHLYSICIPISLLLDNLWYARVFLADNLKIAFNQ